MIINRIYFVIFCVINFIQNCIMLYLHFLSVRTTEAFRRELTLMFFNATMYNSSSHDVYRLSLAMYKDTEGIVQEYLNTQVSLVLMYCTVSVLYCKCTVL